MSKQGYMFYNVESQYQELIDFFFDFFIHYFRSQRQEWLKAQIFLYIEIIRFSLSLSLLYLTSCISQRTMCATSHRLSVTEKMNFNRKPGKSFLLRQEYQYTSLSLQ